MIEPINSAAVTLAGRTQAGSAGGAAPVGTGAGAPVQAEGGAAVRTSAQMLAAFGPPVDAERVAGLKEAIAGGSYAIDPKAIAAALIKASSDQR